jgi:hypothetical protein
LWDDFRGTHFKRFFSSSASSSSSLLFLKYFYHSVPELRVIVTMFWENWALLNWTGEVIPSLLKQLNFIETFSFNTYAFKSQIFLNRIRKHTQNSFAIIPTFKEKNTKQYVHYLSTMSIRILAASWCQEISFTSFFTLIIHCVSGWLGIRASLDMLTKGKILAPAGSRSPSPLNINEYCEFLYDNS